MLWRLQAIGDAQVAGAMGKVKGAMAGMNTETAKSATVQATATTATTQLGAAAAATATKTQSWTSSLGAATAGLGAFSPAVGQSAAAAAGFTTALGPLGVALTAFGVIAPLVVNHFRDIGDAAEEEGERVETMARRIRASMDDLRDFSAQSNAQALEDLQNRADDLEAQIFMAEGRGDAEEARRLRGEQSNVRAELLFGVHGSGDKAPTISAEEQLERDKNRRMSRSSRGGPEAIPADEETLGVLSDILSELEVQTEELEGEASIDRHNTDKDSAAIAGEAAFANAEMMAAAEEAARKQISADDRILAAKEAQTEELERQVALMNEQQESAGEFANYLSFVGSVWSSTIKDVIAGEKSIGDAIRDNLLAVMQGIGEQMIGEGFMKLFQGLFLAVNPTTAAVGAAQIGIGAAEIAAGTALLAGGSAASMSISGGGGAPVPAAPGGDSDGGGGGGTTIIQHINDPVDEERVGRIQDSAARAANRKFGGRV